MPDEQIMRVRDSRLCRLFQSSSPHGRYARFAALREWGSVLGENGLVNEKSGAVLWFYVLTLILIRYGVPEFPEFCRVLKKKSSFSKNV
jgi:hypothetical protein